MSDVEDVDGATKLNCGIWMTLDHILNKENSANVWDSSEPRLKPMQKKKERQKLRFVPTVSPDSPPNGRSKSPLLMRKRKNKKLNHKNNETTSTGGPSVRAAVSNKESKSKCSRRATVITSEPATSCKTPGEENDGYINPLIDCSFNFPRVSAQLERLMGTNVVRLTDRKYMMDLRRRINEDFNDMLLKRIENRENMEAEREKNLILKGFYSSENCPVRLVNAHSIVLAREMERQRDLIMKGAAINCPAEYDQHPVFIANQATNKVIARRRTKLKTNRQRNAERLIRQGAKWEKERLLYDEIDRIKEKELRERQKQALQLGGVPDSKDAPLGMDLLKIKNRDYVECEMELKYFLDAERDKMLSRFRKTATVKSTKSLMGSKKDQRVEGVSSQASRHNDLSRATSSAQSTAQSAFFVNGVPMTASNPNPKSAIAGEVYELSDEDDYEGDTLSALDKDSYVETLTEAEHLEMLNISKTKALQDGYMLEPIDFENLHYEDPKVTQLKQTDTVKEMYELADEIICGLYDKKNLSGGEEETDHKEDAD